MLNDILLIERALRVKNIPFDPIHPDIQDVGKDDLIVLRLSADGNLSELEQRGNREFWTMRDGKQHSFPYMKYSKGLFTLEELALKTFGDSWKDAERKNDSAKKRIILGELIQKCIPHPDIACWPSDGYRKKLRERLEQLNPLRSEDITASVPAAFERFLSALDSQEHILIKLLSSLKQIASNGPDDWLDWIFKAFVQGVNLQIDVATSDFKKRDAGDVRQMAAVSAALNTHATPTGECMLTGQLAPLLAGNFPTVNLPVLGLTFLFSRNEDIPAFGRYGRSGSSAYPISHDVACNISGAMRWVKDKDREGKTWRAIPGERPKSSDLLIAMLAADPELPLADDLVANEDEDDRMNGRQQFENLSARVLTQTQGGYTQDFAQEDVQLLVLRKVDKGNSKTIFNHRTTAGHIHRAAEIWHKACQNLPDWVGFWLPRKKAVKGERPVFTKPLPVRPLSLIKFSRTDFIRRGTDENAVTGVGAAEAFAFFLDDADRPARARRLLSLVLDRRTQLLAGVAGLLHRGGKVLREIDKKTSMRRETLRTATWLGVLLHALGRNREVYMNDSGFRLGQLLAAADAVHLGYCADERDGSVPTTLIGNAVLAMAGKNPRGALSLLLDRWKPYDAWAKRSGAKRAEAEKLKDSKVADERDRGWDIKTAWSQARRLKPVAEALHGALPKRADDSFRAELLLGYLAGLQPEEKGEAKSGGAAKSDSTDSEGDD